MTLMEMHADLDEAIARALSEVVLIDMSTVAYGAPRIAVRDAFELDPGEKRKIALVEEKLQEALFLAARQRGVGAARRRGAPGERSREAALGERPKEEEGSGRGLAIGSALVFRSRWRSIPPAAALWP